MQRTQSRTQLQTLLRELFSTAYVHPRYQEQWRQHGISANQLATLNLGDIPGTPFSPAHGTFFAAPQDKRATAAIQKLLLPLLLGPSHSRLAPATIALLHGIDAYKTGAHLAAALQTRRRPVRIFSPSADRTELVRLLNEQQPTHLIGYPSTIERLAQEQIAGRLSIVPKRIVLFEEPASARTWRLSEAAWSVCPRYLLQFGSLPVAFSYEDQPTTLQPLRSCVIPERTTDAFIPVPEDALGRLVLTSLAHKHHPIVRVATNLLVEQLEENVWNLPLGQPHEVLWFQTFAGGNTFLDPVSLGDMDAPGLKEFQYIRHGIRSLTMLAELSGSPDAAFPKIQKRIEELLEERQLTGAVDFRIEPVESLTPDSQTGQFHRIMHASS